MKFTLKDYQDEAVRDVLDNLRKARSALREDGDRHAFSLTADHRRGQDGHGGSRLRGAVSRR
jgi:type III restriction enzyme